MKKLIAVLFALCLVACAVTGPAPENTQVVNGPVPTATGEIETEAGNLKLILYDTPCTDKTVIAHLKSEVVQYFQRGQVSSDAGTIEMCYRNYPEQGAIFIMDADGDYGPVPMTVFTPHQPL